MNMLLNDTEFFVFEHEVWMKCDNDRVERITPSTITAIDTIIEHLQTFYTEAYEALCDEYKGCSLNLNYYRYRIASRFIRCNMAQLDNTPDYSATTGRFNFEYIPCPLRGECRRENVICRPKFNNNLSAAETSVMRLWYEGQSEDAIADNLCLSPHTVHNHIRNAYQRIGVHSRSEFVKYAGRNNLFTEKQELR